MRILERVLRWGAASVIAAVMAGCALGPIDPRNPSSTAPPSPTPTLQDFITLKGKLVFVKEPWPTHRGNYCNAGTLETSVLSGGESVRVTDATGTLLTTTTLRTGVAAKSRESNELYTLCVFSFEAVVQPRPVYDLQVEVFKYTVWYPAEPIYWMV